LLKKGIFKKERVALIHGRLKSKEKDEIMKDFKEKKYDVLVSTSVVEVGIDVPNATIMIIEGAERYGLAQLHQLRGRVGRGDQQSYCFLFTSEGANSYSQRLQFFTKTNSGMQLAEFDLQNRGAGQIYGTRQSGQGDLQFASLTDLPIIETTKKAAEMFSENYNFSDYMELEQRLTKLQLHRIAKD
jgi:ATP-dependent DNA helicase RecG